MKPLFTLLFCLAFFAGKAQYSPETAFRLNCDNVNYTLKIPLNNSPATPGINYGSIWNTQNAAWVYFPICSAGTVDFNISSMNPGNTIQDSVCYTLFGPFPDSLSITTQIQSANYLAAANLTSGPSMNLYNLQPGIYYMMISQVTRPADTLSVDIAAFANPFNNFCSSLCSYCTDLISLEQLVCTIDLDVASLRNKIVWEKGDTTHISGYVLYRENNISMQFDSLDFIPVTSLSEYIDMTANPAARIWQYKLVAMDNCGNKPNILPYYTRYITLHLQQGVGTLNSINLNWNSSLNLPPIPGSGQWLQSFYIYRGSSTTSMQVIDSVPNTFTAYTDLNPMPGINYYQVEMRKNTPCVPSMLPNNAKSGSNFISTVFTGITELNPSLRFSLQPNPVHDYFRIILSSEARKFENSIRLISMEGKKVAEFSNISQDQQFPVNSFAPGVYIVELSNEKGISRKNLVIQ